MRKSFTRAASRLLNSRKFIVAALTVLLVTYAGRLGLDAEKVLYVGLALLLGYAAAGFGKEGKK